MLVVTAILLAFAIWAFHLPVWLMGVITDIFVSFVISGVFYTIIISMGLEFLERRSILGVLSVMTIVIFLLKVLFT